MHWPCNLSKTLVLSSLVTDATVAARSLLRIDLQRISESGQIFKADDVARDIIFYSSRGYFGIRYILGKSRSSNLIHSAAVSTPLTHTYIHTHIHTHTNISGYLVAFSPFHLLNRYSIFCNDTSATRSLSVI